jgi:hypothetical protein
MTSKLVFGVCVANKLGAIFPTQIRLTLPRSFEKVDWLVASKCFGLASRKRFLVRIEYVQDGQVSEVVHLPLYEKVNGAWEIDRDLYNLYLEYWQGLVGPADTWKRVLKAERVKLVRLFAAVPQKML